MTLEGILATQFPYWSGSTAEVFPGRMNEVEKTMEIQINIPGEFLPSSASSSVR